MSITCEDLIFASRLANLGVTNKFPESGHSKTRLLNLKKRLKDQFDEFAIELRILRLGSSIDLKKKDQLIARLTRIATLDTGISWYIGPA